MKSSPSEYLVAFGVMGLCLALALIAAPFITESDKVMIFLGGVILVAFRAHGAASVTAAALGIMAFNFFFVPPVHTFVVDEARYILTFLTMGAVGLLVSTLVWRYRGRVELEHQRQEEAAQTELVLQTERLRNSLLSSISHDLRTPVGSIVGTAELLKEDLPRLSPERRQALLVTIHTEAQRLQALLENLLQMTRIEGGGLKLRRDWHLTEELVGAALYRIEGLLEGREVLTDLTDELVYVDETSVTAALTNLLENAARYSPPESPLEILAAISDGTFRLEVRDRGIGLEGVEIPRLFEKFERGPHTSDVVGSGLGLSIVRAVVEAHDGEVFAEPREKGGAIFGIIIPQRALMSPPSVEDS